MSDDVTLTAAVRQNLLSLQSTANLVGRTQDRLSTGLRVKNAIDDPVNFFQAKALSDRSSDFNEKKTGIDQGISTLTAATDAITGVESLIAQLKGLAQNAKSATTTTEIDNMVTQYNEIRTQVNLLTSDASYQGLNLVNGTGSTLGVQFSIDTASVLNVKSVDITTNYAGMHVTKVSAYQSSVAISLHNNGTSAGSVANATSVTFTVAGTTAHTITKDNTFTLMMGTQSFSVTVYSAKSAFAQKAAGKANLTQGTYAVGDTIVFATVSAEGASAVDSNKLYTTSNLGETTTDSASVRVVGVGTTTELSARIQNLDSALTTLRSRAQVLGANVAILKTRLDFTTDYVNTLTSGAGKLTLADLNEEGANLLALQTRQQLGVQSLAFAGQSEQSILALFR